MENENLGPGNGVPNTEPQNQMAPRPNLGDFILSEDTPKVLNWVKLPEWSGFWAKVSNTVYILTKDNQILNTPHIEKYGEREDWVSVDKFKTESHDLKVRFLKMQRVRLDLLLLKIEESPIIKSRETSLAYTSIQTAFMWMGKLLGDLGEANPYPQYFDPKSPVIEKRTDTAKDNPQIELLTDLTDLDETGYVKALIGEVSHSINLLCSLKNQMTTPYSEVNFLYPSDMAVIKSLQESNFWLGQQLNNIRLRDDKK